VPAAHWLERRPRARSLQAAQEPQTGRSVWLCARGLSVLVHRATLSTRCAVGPHTYIYIYMCVCVCVCLHMSELYYHTNSKAW